MFYSQLSQKCIGKFSLACFILLSAGFSAQMAIPLRQVRFTENNGQLTDLRGNLVPFVFFKASAPGLDLFITDKGLTYSFLKFEEDEKNEREQKKRSIHDLRKPEVQEYEWEVVNLDLKGANIRRENIEFQEPQQGVHYFYSRQFPDGTPVVHEYGRIIIKEIYPGIDWVLYNSNSGGFKYDFVLHEGANAGDIRLVYQGPSEAKLTHSGQIVVNTEYGVLREDKPVSYLSASKLPVESSFELISASKKSGISTVEFGLALPGRTAGQAVVIDPQLTWSTFFGGSGFEGTMATEVDANGNLFACGYGNSANFPYLNSGTYFEGSSSLSTAAFIIKFSSAGVLLWSTNYTGTGGHQDLAVDNSGNIFLTGSANANMPVKNNSTYFQGTTAGGNDAYILKFDNNGNRIWATFFGGSGYDYGTSVTTDPSGNVFLTGATSSTNFPLMNANTYYVSQLPTNSAFVSKFDNSGALLWSTFYEGLTPSNASTDNAGNLLLTGNTFTNFVTQNPGGGAYYQSTPGGYSDAAVIKFSNSGALTWATFFGGSATEQGVSIIPDRTGRIYVLGTTTSSDMPLQNAGGYYKSTLSGGQDVFMSRFAANGTLNWSTFYGSYSYENISTNDNLAIDSCGNVYASFEANSSGLPIQQSCDGGYLDNQFDSTGANGDLYVVRFNDSTKVTWGSYLGGVGYDFRSTMAVDANSRLLMTGEWVLTTSTMVSNYPMVSPGPGGYLDTTHNGSDDIYITRFAPGQSSQAFGYQGPHCASINSVAPFTASLGSGGTFSATPGLSINPTTGVIYPNGAAAGVYTVSYTNTNAACSCAQNTFASVSTATVQLLAGPSLSVAGSNTPCPGQAITRTVSGAQSYTWSNGFQATILSIKPSTTTVLTITGTAQNGCTSIYTLTIYVKNCTGLGEESLEGIKVYPNPNNGSFTIESQQPAELVLTNMLGQMVRTIQIGKNEQQVEISDLPKGIYFLKDTRSSSGGGLKVVVE